MLFISTASSTNAHLRAVRVYVYLSCVCVCPEYVAIVAPPPKQIARHTHRAMGRNAPPIFHAPRASSCGRANSENRPCRYLHIFIMAAVCAPLAAEYVYMFSYIWCTHIPSYYIQGDWKIASWKSCSLSSKF